MTPPTEVLDALPHEYRVYHIDVDETWLAEAASAYVGLRSEPATRNLNEVIEGLASLQTLDGTSLRERIQRAVIPLRRPGNFDVVRSDLGELMCYRILEEDYGTYFGYKSLRDRELTQSAGRGIDAFGVEDTDPITLVIAEAKVSAERRSPPAVVDDGDECLRQQHLSHLARKEATVNKIINSSLRAVDAETADRIVAAALLFEAEAWEQLRVVTCCLLVRPQSEHTANDFGSFRITPEDFEPGVVRFLVVTVSMDIEDCVQRWYDAANECEVQVA